MRDGEIKSKKRRMRKGKYEEKQNKEKDVI